MEIPILKGSARISTRLSFVCPQLFSSSGFWPVETATSLMQKVGSSSLQITLIVELLVFKDVPYFFLTVYCFGKM
jgi:ribonuclease Z